MPLQEISLNPSGKINRRDPVDDRKPNEPISRENFLVEGVGDSKVNRKIPGSKRLTSSSISSIYRWAFRYYSGNTAKTFAYATDGKIYHKEPTGSPTEVNDGFNTNAWPCSAIMKVGETNRAYFSDGFNGLWSHDGNTGHTFKKEDQLSLNPVVMISFLDRMFYVEENSEDLYFSKVLEPANVDDTTDAGLITIGAKRGSKIMQLVIISETLFIFKEDSIWVLEGRTPETFTVREVDPYMGTVARRSLASGDGFVFFLGTDYNIYSFSGSASSRTAISYNLALGGDLTKDLPTMINKTKMDEVCATYHNRLYRLSFVESGKVTNNLEYIYNASNETDAITRGNNVSCYCKYDKPPDQQELVTGRSDTGYLMLQYYGVNWDQDATTHTMPYKLETAFVGKSIRNKRFTRIWADFQVRGKHDLQLGYLLDSRSASSDKKEETMNTWGESKALTSFVTLSSQRSITSRGILKMGSAKGQSIGFVIDEESPDIDLTLGTIYVELIVKSKKRSKYVGV